MILSAVGVMAAHKQDFQMLGVVDLAAWSTTFLSGSRMWASLGARERSFNPVYFTSFLVPRPICRIKWWVSGWVLTILGFSSEWRRQLEVDVLVQDLLVGVGLESHWNRHREWSTVFYKSGRLGGSANYICFCCNVKPGVKCEGFVSNRAPYILLPIYSGQEVWKEKAGTTHASKLIHNERFSGPASCAVSVTALVLYLKRGSRNVAILLEAFMSKLVLDRHV